MEQFSEFVDLLRARRKDCDILWASRPMDPLLPHKLSPESKYSRKQIIQAVLNDVYLTMTSLAMIRKVDINKVLKEAYLMVNEMASKAHLPTVRWLGTRSRSLKSIVPKFGLLSTILESLLEGGVPDIHFIPISINYERPPEELLFAYELLGVPKPKESTTSLLQSLSILQKPYAYGRVFFNIGEPISAHQFLSMEHRKARVLSPYTKLSSTINEKLAYCIIDSHKKNTILTPFNLVALLFNERSQILPDDPYTLDTLVSDYLWCKNLLQEFSATVYTERSVDINDTNTMGIKKEILNTLKPHEELLVFDSSQILRLRERHRVTKLKNNIYVKGHTLSEKTMQIAVSVINISIYLNPTLSFFIKPAIVILLIGMEGVELGTAFKRYVLLRTLLSTEFAMPLIEDESMIKSEWEETFNFLLRQNYISIRNNAYIQGQNPKVFSLLYNVMLPFIDAIYITCLVLFEWDEAKSNSITIQAVLIEAQRQVEEAFLKGSVWGRHPYSLSLDLFNTTISNLIAQGILIPCERRSTYHVDKIRLALILAQLQSLSLKRPAGLYHNVVLLSALPPTVQAKL
ncbi:dihydroxyacetone phosphate acyltransferase isoform X2 [Ptiloglossa arizonensis]|uniref:dihydroxyacetone phosphate acyltransferase isoform X2 n=1 Tax=Ptiloglossa arizonensis TaxID=3350558 RepID=UPI003FA083F8